ncbi:MAG: recombinase XerD, partial [Alphaproteobacteria bacterium]|nr:recombinase XerD [Alphaproteobacteria bacterium]
MTSAFLDMMLAERASAANSIESYRRDLEGLGEHLATKRRTSLAKAERADIEHYLAYLAHQGFALSSSARKLSCFRQFYHFLVTDKYREDDPSALIDSPRQARSLPGVLSREDMEVLLAQAALGNK